jgi:hypothetical protein
MHRDIGNGPSIVAPDGAIELANESQLRSRYGRRYISANLVVLR